MPKIRDTARPPPSPWASLGMAQPLIDTGEGAQGLLDALALSTMPVPVVGDVAGLASDAYRFATDPESRTLGNAAWASLGMLPFVPFAGAITRPFGKVERGIEADPNYLYHITNTDRAYDIEDAKKLKTHKPWYGTDQGAWPDGSTASRSYFSPYPDTTLSFAPEDGTPALLRVRRDAGPFKRESGTGDFYSEKPIPAKVLEYLSDNGEWLPVQDKP